MPREPPVTRATRPLSEKRSLNMGSSPWFDGGFGRGGMLSQGSDTFPRPLWEEAPARSDRIPPRPRQGAISRGRARGMQEKSSKPEGQINAGFKRRAPDSSDLAAAIAEQPRRAGF